MNKTYYRYFGGLIFLEEQWLNRLAAQGMRLIKTGKMHYTFEQHPTQTVQYTIALIGDQSWSQGQGYGDFLKELGYRVFYKNINLNYSLGKVRWRPLTQKGGRIATNQTTYNRELLIVEKPYDGQPFQLYTTLTDQWAYYRRLRNLWLTPCALFGAATLLTLSPPFLLFTLLTALPITIYQYHAGLLKRQIRIEE